MKVPCQVSLSSERNGPYSYIRKCAKKGESIAVLNDLMMLIQRIFKELSTVTLAGNNMTPSSSSHAPWCGGCALAAGRVCSWLRLVPGVRLLQPWYRVEQAIYAKPNLV
jgi:hypothetical protein